MRISLKIDDLIQDASQSSRTVLQRENLTAITSLARRFMRDAGIASFDDISHTTGGILVESGHQPNFLPHPGFFKKVFLQARIVQCAGERDLPAIAIFGLADQNISTARLLSSNRIPAWNRDGYLKVGFTISPGDRGRIFRAIPIPERDAWEKEWNKIRDHYHKQEGVCRAKSRDFSLNLHQVEEIYARSYERASNFADLNGFFIASLCKEVFELPVLFFRYSDVQEEGLFAKVLHSLIVRRIEYIRAHNVAAAGSDGVFPPLPVDHVPIWLHCPCGGKVPLSYSEDEIISGICPVCHTPHTLPGSCHSPSDLKKALPSLGLNAISRHLIFFEGLGTTIFLSGAGGGVRYGRVAREIATRLALHIPVSIAVRSHDYYLGSTHITGLRESAKLLRLPPVEIASPCIQEYIAEWHEIAREAIQGIAQDPTDKVLRKRLEGDYKNGRIRIQMLIALFSQKPSALDIFVMQGLPQVQEGWSSATRSADLIDETESLYADITYHAGDTCSREFSDEGVEQLYVQIPRLEVNHGS